MFFKPEYILILGFTIVVDYYAGIKIENAELQSQKLKYLILSLIANIGVLCVFKYYNFINFNITGLCGLFHIKIDWPLLKLALPIGLSFHTFQAMSYTIEVYRGNQKAERHFGIYALYVMFYPQLVAGPIERPQNMLHQFHEEHEFSSEMVTSGLRLMMWGLFKKVVIADRIALITDNIFDMPQDYNGFTLLVTAILYAFQIYCDFSGYSDIALGSARTMGFKLMRNFEFPFVSKSVTEFWRRWHVSLSTWFYDYLFNPMVASLRNFGKKAIIFSLMVTFILSGFWHGVGWKFIIFGCFHGGAVVFEMLTKKTRKKINGALPLKLSDFISKSLTFIFLCFTWIFFREKNVSMSMTYIKRLTGVPHEIYDSIKMHRSLSNFHSRIEIVYAIVFILIMNFVQKIDRTQSADKFLANYPMTVRYAVYYFFAFSILFFGVFTQQSFIYFQF